MGNSKKIVIEALNNWFVKLFKSTTNTTSCMAAPAGQNDKIIKYMVK